MVALWFAYYNWCRLHPTLRVTPAMAGSFSLAASAPHLGEDVLAYGYPAYEEGIPPSRLMKGHIQRHYFQADSDSPYRYTAYELGFYSFPGLSGAPVFLNANRSSVVGLVTQSVSLKESGAPLWAIGASLVALSDWIRSL